MMPNGPDRRVAPPSLTEEQLNLLTSQTEHATHKALRSYSQKAIAGFLILVVGILAVQIDQRNSAANSQRALERTAVEARAAIVRSGQVVAVQGCNRDFRRDRVIRGILIASRFQARARVRRGDINRAQFKESLAFYKDQLSNVVLPDCRQSRDVLTDDPSDEIRIPRPLYPERDG